MDTNTDNCALDRYRKITSSALSGLANSVTLYIPVKFALGISDEDLLKLKAQQGQ